MDLVFDPAIALFAGLNVVPKRSYLAAYSSRVDHRANVRLMDAWFEQIERSRLAAWLLPGSGLPHRAGQHRRTEPLEKHYVSSRSRRQQGILVFLARDAEQRVFRYANAGDSQSRAVRRDSPLHRVLGAPHRSHGRRN